MATKTSFTKKHTALIILLAIGAACTPSFLKAGTFEKDSSVIKPRIAPYIELGGNGILYSANLDISENLHGDKLGFAFSAGYSAFPGFYTSIPVRGSVLIGSSPHYLELGAGVTFIQFPWTMFGYQLTGLSLYFANAGYRYQPSDKGVLFKAFLSIPYLGTLPPDEHLLLLVWCGLGVGYSF